jgi:tetratricopeptide (TPR) repeat protein
VTRAVFAIAIALCAVAHADPEHDADLAFRRADDRAIAGDPAAVGELEAIGAARPITRWTDDAWLEAARLAETLGDLPRARSDLEAALVVTTDPLLARRANAALARLTPLESWTAVDDAHQALVDRIQHPAGDPKLALCELGAIVLASPGYPRALAAMLALARGWERDGAIDAARTWLDRAAQLRSSPADREHVTAERARFELRGGDTTVARASIAALRDPQLRAQLDHELARADWRRRFREVSWLALAALAIAAIVGIARRRASWRVMLVPPVEVLFLAPVAAVLIGVAATGNPLVSRAVRVISIAGVAVAWIAAALGPPPSRARAALRAVLAAIAVLAATYLACDHDRMIDIVIETWHSGPVAR